jgi:glucosamine--fructose-6-phosphate aminotransferase (isomerizing)
LNDYTVQRGSFDVTDQLENQMKLSTKHLSSSWPVILKQARSLPPYQDLKSIIICGCGDSHHASIGLSMGFSSISPGQCIPSNSMNASRYLIPQLGERAHNTLVIAISASGEVARTIEAIEVANHFGARTLAFTGRASGTLARTANQYIAHSGPELPHGPGLISYLTSLLMGYALLYKLSETGFKERLEQAFEKLISEMEPWIQDRWREGALFADEAESGTCVFLGSGPLFGSALFAAAKLLEASGEYAWGQDVEEWAHLEYFGSQASMRTWLLSAEGRSLSRELEVRTAAAAIGRKWHEDRWLQLKQEFGELNEILAPLTLWAGPCGYAARRTEIRGEIPFRDFGGGRDREEGGGPSRIRSSKRSISLGQIE